MGIRSTLNVSNVRKLKLVDNKKNSKEYRRKKRRDNKSNDEINYSDNNNNENNPDDSSSCCSKHIPATHKRAIAQVYGSDCDLYSDILNISRSTSQREIRNAFLKFGNKTLAGRRVDVLSYDELSDFEKARFEATTMAYEILSHAVWKQEYDKYGLQRVAEEEDSLMQFFREEEEKIEEKENEKREERLHDKIDEKTSAVVAQRQLPTSRRSSSILKTRKYSIIDRETSELSWAEHLAEDPVLKSVVSWNEDVEELVFKQSEEETAFKARRKKPERKTGCCGALQKKSNNCEKPQNAKIFPDHGMPVCFSEFRESECTLKDSQCVRTIFDRFEDGLGSHLQASVVSLDSLLGKTLEALDVVLCMK